jgi:hypothetical protein
MNPRLHPLLRASLLTIFLLSCEDPSLRQPPVLEASAPPPTAPAPPPPAATGTRETAIETFSGSTTTDIENRLKVEEPKP